MILCENKRILRKKGSENFEANKRNGSLFTSFRFEAKKNISENLTPYNKPASPNNNANSPCFVGLVHTMSLCISISLFTIIELARKYILPAENNAKRSLELVHD
jgi:hypothetical protein